VAGVHHEHFLISSVIEGAMLLTIQAFEIIIYVNFFLFENQSLFSKFALFLILYLLGFVAMIFGLICSIISKSVIDSFAVLQFVLLPSSIISGKYFDRCSLIFNELILLLFEKGALWPLEGMALILKYFGILLPFTMPVVTFRKILVRDLDFHDGSFQYSILNLSIWIVVETLIAIKLIKK
jgi:hypothetical protein